MEETTDTYIFIVFMCNKVLAIILLPLLLVVAFASSGLSLVALTLCLCFGGRDTWLTAT